MEAARHYLQQQQQQQQQQQLETHSWWTKEQPGEARHEFTLRHFSQCMVREMAGFRTMPYGLHVTSCFSHPCVLDSGNPNRNDCDVTCVDTNA